MTEPEAYRFVMGVLAQNARGDSQAIEDLASTVAVWDTAEILMVLQAAVSVAFAAHLALAEVAGEPPETFIGDLALDAAAEDDEA